MSRVAPTAEKIMAVAGTFSALAGELEGRLDLGEPRVQAALLGAATVIAMQTDTRDMGILGSMPPLPGERPDLSMLVDRRTVRDDLKNGVGEHQPCDDCGAEWGEPHDLSIEH